MTKQAKQYSDCAKVAAKCARRFVFSMPDHSKRGREARILLRSYRANLRAALQTA